MPSEHIDGCVNAATGEITFVGVSCSLGDYTACLETSGVHAGQVGLTISDCTVVDYNDTYYGDWNKDTGRFRIFLPVSYLVGNPHLTDCCFNCSYCRGQTIYFTPANVEIGDIFYLTAPDECGSPSIFFIATDNTVANVTDGLAAAWNASFDYPMTNITATDKTTYIELRADIYIPYQYNIVGTTINGGDSDTQTLSRNDISSGSPTPRVITVTIAGLTNLMCYSRANRSNHIGVAESLNGLKVVVPQMSIGQAIYDDACKYLFTSNIGDLGDYGYVDYRFDIDDLNCSGSPSYTCLFSYFKIEIVRHKYLGSGDSNTVYVRLSVLRSPGTGCSHNVFEAWGTVTDELNNGKCLNAVLSNTLNPDETSSACSGGTLTIEDGDTT